MSTQVGFRWWHAALVVGFIILIGKFAMYQHHKKEPKYEEAASPAPAEAPKAEAPPPVYEEPRAVAPAEAPPPPAPTKCTTDYPCGFIGFRGGTREEAERELAHRISLPGCNQATTNRVEPFTGVHVLEYPLMVNRFNEKHNGDYPSFVVVQEGFTDDNSITLCGQLLQQEKHTLIDDR